MVYRGVHMMGFILAHQATSLVNTIIPLLYYHLFFPMASVRKNHVSGFDSVTSLLKNQSCFTFLNYLGAQSFQHGVSKYTEADILFPIIVTSRGRWKDSNAEPIAKGLLSIEEIVSWKGGRSNAQS